MQSMVLLDHGNYYSIIAFMYIYVDKTLIINVQGWDPGVFIKHLPHGTYNIKLILKVYGTPKTETQIFSVCTN